MAGQGVQVKVECREKRFATFLIEEIYSDKLIIDIKKNFSTLAHWSPSNIRLRYRDEDGDMVNLSDENDFFHFREMLRSAKEVKDQNDKTNLYPST